mmetsp:Transcript_122844/g.342328  ORF Transcript_122844/g.342328 Transcript_122844/m.342328 type:complete len:413 (-) Transcript_122844:138-1376(-)
MALVPSQLQPWRPLWIFALPLLSALLARHASGIRDGADPTDDIGQLTPGSEENATQPNASAAATSPPESHHLPYCEALADQGIAPAGPKASAHAARLARAGRPFLPDEEQAGFVRLGLEDGGGASCQASPVAVFVLGPPASGKAAAVEQLKAELSLDGGEGPSGYDAVLLDGDILREHHRGYQDLLAWGQDQKCIVKEAWKLLRPRLREVKLRLMERATAAYCRRNLVLPSTCVKWEACAQNVATLKQKGYNVSVIGVYGPREAVIKRGLSLADRSGEAYSVKTFTHSLVAFIPIMALGNGRCELVNNTAALPLVSASASCPNQDAYSPAAALATPFLTQVQDEVIQGAAISHEEYAKAEEQMGIASQALIGRNTSAGQDNGGAVSTHAVGRALLLLPFFATVFLTPTGHLQ